MKLYRSKKSSKRRTIKRRSKLGGGCSCRLSGGFINYEYIIFNIYQINFFSDYKSNIDYNFKRTFYFPFYVTSNEEAMIRVLKQYFQNCINFNSSRTEEINNDIFFFLSDKNEIYVEYDRKQILIGYIDMISSPVLPVEKIFYNDEDQNSKDRFYPLPRQHVLSQPYGGFRGGRIVSMEFQEIDVLDVNYKNLEEDINSILSRRTNNNNRFHYIFWLSTKLFRDYKYYMDRNWLRTKYI